MDSNSGRGFWRVALAAGAVAALAAGVAPFTLGAAPAAVPDEVTYSKDIAPILQRSCENCHRPNGAGPMSLSTYEEVRPWARAIKQRTGIGPHAGVMPPWYMEKNIGIQRYKDDPSLSAVEVARGRVEAVREELRPQHRPRRGGAAAGGLARPVGAGAEAPA